MLVTCAENTLLSTIIVKMIERTSGAVLCGIYTVFTLLTIWDGRWLPSTKNQLQVHSGTVAFGEPFTSTIEYLMDVVSMTGWRGICHCPLFDSVASTVEVAYYSFSDMPRMTLFAIFATVHSFVALFYGSANMQPISMRLHNLCAAIFYSTPPCVAKTAGAAGPIRAVRAANCYLSCAAASIGASLLYVLAASVITALAYIFLAFLLCTHGLQKFCARSTVRTWTILVVLACAPGVSAGDAESSKMPMFNGTKLGYAMWYITWGAWVAMKAPDLCGLFDGTDNRTAYEGDEEADPPVQADSDGLYEWDKNNRKLYGFILNAVPDSLKMHLATHCKFNGVACLGKLATRFAVTDSADRGTSLMKISHKYIEPNAGICVKDISL